MNYFNKTFKNWTSLLLFIGIMVSLLSCNSDNQLRVLVFSKTMGFKHASIPDGIAAIEKLGIENNFLMDTTKNSAHFTEDNLKKYHAVIFLNTTHNVLNAQQQVAFERYIQAGSGFVGIHAAADTEYEWPWYNKLVGAYFNGHPNKPNVRKATIDVIDTTHLATAGLPEHWERKDEWYNLKSINPDIKILAKLDENSYEGGTNGDNHPIAWYHEYDGGRAFYTGLGHTEESFSEPLFLKHLLGGIKYAIGTAQPLDFTKSYSMLVPEENRFVKKVLVNDLNEPMELAVAKDGSVFYSERKGKVWAYNPATGKPTLVWEFDVQTDKGFGLLGLTIDPDFETNRFIYIFYSPVKEKYKHYISRFTLNPDNTLIPASEKILLEIPVEMEPSFHHGGSLAFDKDKNLIIATGDNTGASPYAPIDERPDRLTHDAQRSAANSNDLRGKILRIHPEADGIYTIPEGNLFPEGTARTRPEIYAMGVRNPFRVTAHPITSSVYWGEVGPDAGNDGKEGPRGYDEFNQAKKAGNYGWPYIIADNKAYNVKNYMNDQIGGLYNPDTIVNNSPNNTGLEKLPPAQKATVWYPYAESPDFEDMGQGGRCAIAGEIYSFDKSSDSPVKFPEYYDNTWFIFDWIRNWAKIVRFDKDENFIRVEPFMSETGGFLRPMDAAFGKDGALYVLEYGSVYGADNDDARLVKIEYNSGNRKPVARATVSDSIGVAPFKVSFSSEKSFDFDEEDQLSYQWLFDGRNIGSTEANSTFTYTSNGIYSAILKVTDKSGAVGVDTIEIKVGNTLPQVAIEINDNKTFYWEDVPLEYTIKVTDKEDSTTDPKMAKVYFDYYAQPVKQEQLSQHQVLETLETNTLGKSLVAESDCKACHKLEERIVGPSFTDIALRYKGDGGAVDRLAGKIIDGGSGVWGESPMSAHPQLSDDDASEMVKYILSIAEGKKKRINLPLEGSLKFNEHIESENGIYILNGHNQPTLTSHGEYRLIASYTDKGGNGVGPLTDTKVMNFRYAKISPLEADEMYNINNWKNVLRGIRDGSYFLFKNIDMTNIRKLTYYLSSRNRDAQIEVHLDSPEGPIISTATYKATGGWDKKVEVSAPVTPTNGIHDLYFLATKETGPKNNLFMLDWIKFQRN
jgi:cytochrome c